MKHFSEDDVTALRNSDQFNADWYLEQYPDVKMLAMDPFEHYLWLGRRLHRKPQPDMLFIKERINWGIISTPHTIFIADIIAERLRLHGWHVDIMTSPPENFDHDQYFVICPQMFDRLPSGEKLISFQMEQSINERWFTQSYLEILENSFAVLDYSLVNVDFLSGKGINYPHLYYLPVGTLDQRSGSCDKNIDVLFYGDSKSSKRRREMLDALCSEFNVYVASEVFGSEMTDLIRRSKLVINLHYYENALLEMPRIQECLSNGTQVVSESAQDQCHYPELIGAVQFFETGSIAAMLRTVREALSAYEKVEYDIGEKIKSSVSLSAKRFAFMFDRFLIGKGFLPASCAYELALPISGSVERVALSLPETINRRQAFEAVRPVDCAMFDGFRRHPGWLGCGLSYSALARHAMKNGRKRLNIMEDDVVFPTGFESKIKKVNRYLEEISGKWDIFSGIIADLHPDVKVISVDYYEGIKFVTIDKMTSMVFNIYNEKALNILSIWDPLNFDDKTNTIDRFLELQDSLRIVVALPFLVGHHEDLKSTLWGFSNTQYNDMIKKSEIKLHEMADRFLNGHEGVLGRDKVIA